MQPDDAPKEAPKGSAIAVVANVGEATPQDPKKKPKPVKMLNGITRIDN